jgi:hypothetical protein
MVRRWSARFAAPLALTVILFAASLAGAPVLSDPVAGSAPSSLYLKVPLVYLGFAPVFTLWDGVSMLSMSRLKGLLVGLVVLYLVWRVIRLVPQHRRSGSLQSAWLRELGVLAVSVFLLLVFLIMGALWHRPMLALAGVGPNELVVDFHSHTKASHDVRNTLMRGFDAEANRRWHRRAGFDAAFITDHNIVEGSGTRDRGAGSYPVLCPGIEVSAWRAHVVLLGDTMPVDHSRYNRSLQSLLALLRTSDSAYGSLSLASLPEYQRNHWSRLDQLVGAGLDGFEIVNAAPKANELRQAQRDTVIALARAHNRFVAGVSDSHGWGATSMVWNLVRAPKGGSTDNICSSVLGELGVGFPAVRVIERHRLRSDSWWPMWLTPAGVVWETWRSMGGVLTISWLVWIWVLFSCGWILRGSR